MIRIVLVAYNYVFIMLFHVLCLFCETRETNEKKKRKRKKKRESAGVPRVFACLQVSKIGHQLFAHSASVPGLHQELLTSYLI
mmetsp:Transcript_6166/g.15218  ORF Transcript_6166/g.15218 Transcript_6166/m.15218 type:complete len:83 (-) Transcript_6166:4694-4942(-)